MLGIDIGPEAVSIVELRQRRGRIVWLQAERTELSAGGVSDPQQLADIIAELLTLPGWRSRRAVMTLPRQSCFVRALPAELSRKLQPAAGRGHLTRQETHELIQYLQGSLWISPNELELDIWLPHKQDKGSPKNPQNDTPVLLGAVPRSTVDFAQAVVSYLDLDVQSLSMRPLARINGLYPAWREAQNRHIAVCHLESGHGQCALIAPEGLRGLHAVSLNGRATSEAGQVGPATPLGRLLHVPRAPDHAEQVEALYLSPMQADFTESGSAADDQPSILPDEPMASVISCDYLPEGLDVQGEFSAEKWNQYAAAIGAALEGLKQVPTSFNFLHTTLRQRPGPSYSLIWKALLVLAAGLIVTATVLWRLQIQERRELLRDLQHLIDQAAPEEAILLEARENWTHLRPYIRPAADGSRYQTVRLLYEISRLFPDTEEAYITEMLVEDRLRTDATYDIAIRGKSRQSEVVTQLIETLNESPLLHDARRGGSITQDTSDAFYPFRFSITCNFARPGQERSP